MRIESVNNILLDGNDNIPLAKRIIEALEFKRSTLFICRRYCSRRDAFCSYSGIAMYSYDLKALTYVSAVKCRKRSRENVFVFREDSRDDLDNFNFMNSIDSSQKIQFTTSSTTKNVLEFKYLTLSFDATSKQISVDVFSKPTNSSIFLSLFTCFPRRNIEKVLGKRFGRICETDSKFKIRSNKYQQYLIARGYKSHKVSKKFSGLAKISKETARELGLR